LYARILVAVDGSETSKRALREAVALVKDQRASLRVLHVIDVNAYGAELGVPIDQWRRSARESGQQILDGAVALAREQDVAVEAVLREKDLAHLSQAVLDEVARWPADLVILGTHGRSGLTHLLLGSVAEGVVHQATVPVLLVRGQ
jgi:nucleotide-binding universal stress UspA family protein